MKKNRLIERLKQLPEVELRLLLVKLFNIMGFAEVNHNHGKLEFGKDIVFYETDKLKNYTWYACVIKAKDVYQSDYEDINRQIRECFQKKYSSHSHGNVKINKVIVGTNGVFKENPKVMIADKLDEDWESKTSFWDVTDVAQKLIEFDLADEVLQSANLAYNELNKAMLGVLSIDHGLKVFENDFDSTTVDKFQIQIRAKAREVEYETTEYLKAIDLKANVIPAKYLPPIEELVLTSKPILIHGIATSGKTSTLKKLGRFFIQNSLPGFTFYFELSKLNFLEVTSFENLIQDEYVKITGTRLDFTVMKSKNEHILLLLDGYDEIVSSEYRQKVIEMIKKVDHAVFKTVLSSRTNDSLFNDQLIIDNFNSYELLPLTINEMIELGTKVLQDDSKTGNFVKLLRKNEIIQSFPKTPLTTILLAILFKDNKIDIRDLPKNVTELYSKFIDVFLNKWDKTKGISEQFKIVERQFVLQKIAEYMQIAQITAIPEKELLDMLLQLSKERPISEFADPQGFVEQLCQRCGLLVKNEDDNSYQFFHLTIQEYLSASVLAQKDETHLIEHFLENWWLNSNIFYAGKTPHHSDILKRVSSLKEVYPANDEARLAYIVHASKVLQAAFLLDNQERIEVLVSMVTVFDQMVRDLTQDFIENTSSRVKKRTLLELILWVRRSFVEFFGSMQFLTPLDEMRAEINQRSDFTDITKYCLAYCVAVKKHDSAPLMEFVFSSGSINPRWFKIVDVDIYVKNLKVPNNKLQAKIKSKSKYHKDYIRSQFKERLELHFKSITGLVYSNEEDSPSA